MTEDEAINLLREAGFSFRRFSDRTEIQRRTSRGRLHGSLEISFGKPLIRIHEDRFVGFPKPSHVAEYPSSRVEQVFERILEKLPRAPLVLKMRT